MHVNILAAEYALVEVHIQRPVIGACNKGMRNERAFALIRVNEVMFICM